MCKKILVVAAHPDDEILGCGGTVSDLIKKGFEAYTFILGEGVTSRDENRDLGKRKTDLENLREEILNANEIIGVKKVFTYNFPDNRFDSINFLDIVKTIEEVKNEIKPDIIFTHSKSDLNIDHQITYRAVLTATRPMKGETVKEVYSFEILSSTEWNYPISFTPNVYFDIKDTMNLKLKAMEKYSSELREYPHPRSLKGIKLKAKQRGLEVGLEYAEAFELVRKVIIMKIRRDNNENSQL